MAKAFFVDLTRCTGCRGCQIACKQWKNLPAEETMNCGGHTNPPDLSSVTYKTVHMREVGKGKDFRMLFFPEQCCHCELAPCMTASTIDGAIVQDEKTGAVLFTPLTAQLDAQAVREARPYDIPRVDPQTKQIHKCDFCNDWAHQGMLPACVLSCPTGCMNFGEREDMENLVEQRLAEVKERFLNAVLGDNGIVHVIHLYAEDLNLYHKLAVLAQNDANPMTRRQLFAKLRRPVAQSSAPGAVNARKELLTLAVVCLLCVPAFVADDEEPKGVSDTKEVGKAIRNPITIEATGGKQKMDVAFNHSSHRRVRCQTCHHALPSDTDAKYVSCGASEECHSVPRGDDGVAPSLFKAFHAKDSDHSCYGCHMKKRKQYTGFQKGCLPCHEKAQKDPKAPAVVEKTLN